MERKFYLQLKSFNYQEMSQLLNKNGVFSISKLKMGLKILISFSDHLSYLIREKKSFSWLGEKKLLRIIFESSLLSFTNKMEFFTTNEFRLNFPFLLNGKDVLKIWLSTKMGKLWFHVKRITWDSLT